jgi:hypothetical protein
MGTLFTIAVGAVLTYAVHYTLVGINIHIIGIIIMLAGAAALIAIVIRATTEAQQRGRSEERQDKMLRTRSQRMGRTDPAYVQNPPQAYAPAPPAPGVAPYPAAEQRTYDTPSPTMPYQPVEQERR